jgi:hypothetical protein
VAVEGDKELNSEELEGDEPLGDVGDDGELDEEDDTEQGAPRTRAPWHFKILLVGTVGYLLWRLYQGIGWLVHHA